jgi:hypothetical protein
MSRTAKTQSTSSPSEELLTLLWNKCESTKTDLEKNWTYQMVMSVVSLGLVFGLGTLISKYLFQEEGRENVIYIVAPMISLYLFMRFGGLLTAFSNVRMDFEQLSEEYVKLTGCIVQPSTLSNTNSYFEYYHRDNTNLAILMYCLFVPIVLATNTSTSLYLIWKQIGDPPFAALICFIYLIPTATLYYMFYINNKHNKFGLSSIAMALVLTAASAIVFVVYSDSLRIAEIKLSVADHNEPSCE